MFKPQLHFNPVSAMRIFHAFSVVLMIAWLIALGVKLYSEFYLPYNLEDPPIVSTTTVRDDPNAKLILQAVDLLGQRRATTTASVIPNIFWLATSTATKK
jgi:acyl-CoA synthetase (AMP-forming)/AMP-acid ligase II